VGIALKKEFEQTIVKISIFSLMKKSNVEAKVIPPNFGLKIVFNELEIIVESIWLDLSQTDVFLRKAFDLGRQFDWRQSLNNL
jgi:hypothetical protein